MINYNLRGVFIGNSLLLNHPCPFEVPLENYGHRHNRRKSVKKKGHIQNVLVIYKSIREQVRNWRHRHVENMGEICHF